MKKIIYFTFLVVALYNTACKKKQNNPEPYNYTNVPDGGTAVIENTNLINKGLIQNNANTTFLIKGNVSMDDLSVIGNVVIEQGAKVEVKGLVNIAGGAKLTLKGKLTCKNFTQIGDVSLSNATLTIEEQFTNSGATKLYLENSLVSTQDLRILGNIIALENDNTKNGNVYSCIYFTGNNKYLNRAGGSSICGPVVFTYNQDMGASGVKMLEISAEIVKAKSTFYEIYSLPNTEKIYQYNDQNCNPTTIAGF